MQRRFILTLSSFFGLGYLRPAPGTWGTLGAIPLWWLLADLSWPMFSAAVLALTGVSVVICQQAEAIYGHHDVSEIVLDEVVGMLIAAVAVPFRWPQVLAAFILFRLFDIWKPFPIRWIDREVKGGLGVVLDDVLAGLFALAVLHGCRWIVGDWW